VLDGSLFNAGKYDSLCAEFDAPLPLTLAGGTFSPTCDPAQAPENAPAGWFKIGEHLMTYCS